MEREVVVLIGVGVSAPVVSEMERPEALGLGRVLPGEGVVERVIAIVARTVGNNTEELSLNAAARPLDGLRVIELDQLLAGPFTGTILAYFGAEVIKAEPPGAGDPIRGWREVKDGTSLWYRSLGRNPVTPR